MKEKTTFQVFSDRESTMKHLLKNISLLFCIGIISLNAGCMAAGLVRSDPENAPTEIYPATCTDTTFIFLCLLGIANKDNSIPSYLLGLAIIPVSSQSSIS